MADVFISYSSKDRARVAPLAERLIAAGYSVWWDNDIRGGADFAQTIEREVKAAKAVVVAWTEDAIASQWVRDEASLARNEGKLIPLLLGVDEPPMGFRQVQAIDFRQWAGDAEGREFLALIAALTEKVSAVAPAAARSSPFVKAKSFALRRRLPLVIAAAAVAGAVAISFVASMPRADAEKIALGEVEIRPFAANPPDAERSARASSATNAFQQRLTEFGISNAPPGERPGERAPELAISGELTRDGDKDVLTARIEDHRSGAALWTVRREPTEGAAWEANLAGFSLNCALKRRDPRRGTEMFSRYIYGCAHYLDGDRLAQYEATKAVYGMAPGDPKAIAFFAFGNMALGWGGSNSKAQRDHYLGEARRLAEAALKLDPKSGDALFAMGFTYEDPQFAEQERWWKAAVAIESESGIGSGRYGSFLIAVGRIREAMDMEVRAARYRRTLAITRTARLVAGEGDWETAKSLYDLIRPFDPEYVRRRELLTEIMYGDVEAASRGLAEGAHLAGRDLPCWTNVLAARRKETLDAAPFAEACGGYFESASFFALAGDIDGAYRQLELISKSSTLSDFPNLFGPEMRDFLRDSRFWPLAARLGLVDYWLDTDQWPDFCGEPDLPIDCREKAAAARAGDAAAKPAASKRPP